MRGFHRGALQRQVPKRPHKPSSQDLGARTLERQHWRKAASLERPPVTQLVSSNTTALPTAGYVQYAGGPLVPVAVPVRTRSYRPTPKLLHYSPR